MCDDECCAGNKGCDFVEFDCVWIIDFAMVWCHMIEELRHLLPKELDCSVVIVDTWKPLWEAGEKLFEVKREDVDYVLDRLKSSIDEGFIVFVYDKEGNVVAEYDGSEKEYEKQAEEEDRVYIKPEEITSLPKGLKIYRGPRGGIYYRRSEYEQLMERKEEKSESPTEKQITYMNNLKRAITQRIDDKWKNEYESGMRFGIENRYFDLIALVALKMWIRDKTKEVENDKRKMSDYIDKLKKVENTIKTGIRGLHMSLPKILGNEYETYYDRVVNALYDVEGKTADETSKMKLELLNRLWNTI